MRRLPVSAVPFLAASLLAVPLLAVTGCAGDSPVGAEPSTSTTYAPATPPASSPTPSPSPTPPCVPTAGMDDAQRLAYLKDLKYDEIPSMAALSLTDSGIRFTPDRARRPCEAVPVQVSHFRVDTTRYQEEGKPTPAPLFTLRPLPGAPTQQRFRYSFSYEALSTVTVDVGPEEGGVPPSRPPATEKCAGTLSVVHIGKRITVEELPKELDFSVDTRYGTAWNSVDLSADRVLDAVFLPPPIPDLC
ncbi:hypothetical protein ACWGHM_17260 [Streptomyces sp. NPDC054904]|uniref:hypothetical protein n=1 Tax=unclassified Streptomyces TaxID=2593676 RepID=UPI0024819D88|nr:MULTISPECIES: hypothetical protein [unclassified Streptomyces]MDA5285788.1 hypothetical protein [Streptomyces sp. Isolate_45]MDX2395975.1 hypothetical protein [Streptomyces sp. DK15]